MNVLYDGQTNSSIPSSNIFYPFYLSPSFVTVKVLDYICGNGVKNETEVWDDGNNRNGDGCSSDCKLEYEYTCSGGLYSWSSWNEIWGNGIRLNSNITYWDDGNTKSGDGWNNIWAVEAGWTWSGGTTTSKDSWSEICGDGKRFNSNVTYWDDGNKIAGDGCNSSWVIEADWIWSGGNKTSADIWTEICGDGKRFNSNVTYWDDHNTISGDGWNNIWGVEAGWTWSGGTTTSKDSWSEICGDGIRFNTNVTYWDDGNKIAGDGCNSSWVIETGWTWSGGTSTSSDIWTEICGDGKRYNSDTSYWDDGNTITSDGWNSAWAVEAGWTWSGGTTTSADSWSEIWGDGIRFNSNTTYWDDENTKSGDGWSISWAIETGWTWSGGTTTSKDSWTEICGDGIRFNFNNAYWDDGNFINGDGWNSTWAVEYEYICKGGTNLIKDTWIEICGDGIRLNSNTTYWDDGNIKDGDGWSISWAIETGWTWSGGTTTSKDSWTEICGDGIRFNSNNAYWDDGNFINGDGWNSTWAVEYEYICKGGTNLIKDTWIEICGDGIRLNSNTTYWDDGNIKDGDGWSSSWAIETGWSWSSSTTTSTNKWSEICGDGKRFNTNTTYWDDGNTIDGDGCSNNWIIETGWSWSGGTLTSSDICTEICGDGKRFNTNITYWDDGNLNNYDGCNSTWSIEYKFKWIGGSNISKDVCYEILIVTTQEAAAAKSTQAAVGAGASPCVTEINSIKKITTVIKNPSIKVFR